MSDEVIEALVSTDCLNIDWAKLRTDVVADGGVMAATGGDTIVEGYA